MKLVLISPKVPLYRHRGGIFKQNLRYAPLTLTTLAAYIPPELNIEVEIIDEGIEDVDLNLNADLIGMTVITGSSERAYKLADRFRSLHTEEYICLSTGAGTIASLSRVLQSNIHALVAMGAKSQSPGSLACFSFLTMNLPANKEEQMRFGRALGAC